jgi:hypothetical protein
MAGLFLCAAIVPRPVAAWWPSMSMLLRTEQRFVRELPMSEPTKFVTIRMADHEWSSQQGGQIMQNLALEYLATHPAIGMVEVMEHGGWWLSFARNDDGAGVMCVNSANDQAHWSDAVKAWWKANQDLHYVGSVRRQEMFEEKSDEQPASL